ncbi:MAG: DUF3244 domain-containing protein [Paludibacteraceae bacterium]|nr:DUF3244 domain-containing protein [Paludibacteraceae bacterium]
MKKILLFLLAFIGMSFTAKAQTDLIFKRDTTIKLPPNRPNPMSLWEDESIPFSAFYSEGELLFTAQTLLSNARVIVVSRIEGVVESRNFSLEAGQTYSISLFGRPVGFYRIIVYCEEAVYYCDFEIEG